ncbi:MAG TPA: hypothetical protein VKV34_09455 [Thermoleophilia bacterium]|nr:hypothetical protein [Thermoleophilia bacterium]
MIIPALGDADAEACDPALTVEPPDPEQLYASNPIKINGIPTTTMRRRQYTAGGWGPTGRRKDPTGGHFIS